MRDRVNYWLMTREGPDTGHPQGAIFRAPWDMAEAEAVEACSRERRMDIDTAILLRPTTYENLCPTFPVINAQALRDRDSA